MTSTAPTKTKNIRGKYDLSDEALKDTAKRFYATRRRLNFVRIARAKASVNRRKRGLCPF